MIRLVVFLPLLLLALVGCDALPRVGFVNHTPQSEAFLWAQWRAARATVMQGGEDLTRISTLKRHTPPVLLPGDPRALRIEPRGLLVESLRDQKPGQVLCPQPCDVTFDASYSIWGKSVVYAASLDHDPAYLAASLQYEFVSQILFQLHYNVSWR